MKRVSVLILAGLFVVGFAAPASAEDGKVVGDEHSVDTKYSAPFNVNVEKWFAEHPVESGKMTRMETVFQTPRVLVTALAAAHEGQLLDLHYHTSADEIMLVVKGQCEEYIDGKWVSMKPGDIHYNPRGVIHGGRVVGDGPFYALFIFTPPPPGGNDRRMLNSDITTAKPGAIVGDWSLLDTQHKKGALFNLDEWYAKNPIEPGKTFRIDPVMGTLRGQLMIAQKPSLPVHYHGSADEIIYVYNGTGEMYINGEWTKLNAGDIHFCPRALIHGIRPADKDKDFKIFAVFAPPQAGGNDRIFREDLK